MAATVHGDSRFGITADVSATDLLLGDLTYDYSVDIVYAQNHIGNRVSMALLNDVTEVSFSGVVADRDNGFTLVLGDALTLANESVGGSLNDQNLMSTPTGGANTIITNLSLKRMNADFESGDGKALYNPLINTGSPTVVT